MILCRNLAFTYFDDSLQAEILLGLVDRLNDGGFLVLGIHEAIPDVDTDLARLDPKLPIYRRGLISSPVAFAG